MEASAWRKSPEIETKRLPSSQIKECPDELIGPRVSKEMGWKMYEFSSSVYISRFLSAAIFFIHDPTSPADDAALLRYHTAFV